MAKTLKVDVTFKQTKREITLYTFLIALDDRGYWIKEKLYAAMENENKNKNNI